MEEKPETTSVDERPWAPSQPQGRGGGAGENGSGVNPERRKISTGGAEVDGIGEAGAHQSGAMWRGAGALIR